MNYVIQTAILVVLFPATLLAQEPQTQEPQAPTASKNEETPADSAKTDETIAIVLPADPDAVVLTYHIEGGYRNPVDEGLPPTKLFRLFANGKVVIGRDTLRATELEYTMTKEEVNELLEEIVNEKKIFEFSTDSINKKIKDTGKPFYLMNAPKHQISIALADKKHEVQVEGLVSTRRFYREVDELQTFAQLHDKFMFLRARAALGTQDEVDKLMKAMVKDFKKQFPGAEPLKLEDVESAILEKDGRLLAQFIRVDYKDGRAVVAFKCTVVKEDGKTTLSLGRVPLG